MEFGTFWRGGFRCHHRTQRRVPLMAACLTVGGVFRGRGLNRQILEKGSQLIWNAVRGRFKGQLSEASSWDGDFKFEIFRQSIRIKAFGSVLEVFVL
ncbi:hypothetical protein CDAR_89651 [Caerostris darwini]|uniref:Uncharacterized protein n=1 Tax=Caerostris darwini TaxID=1538125 RepID=A0AAV4RN92_9ARAC|nr:hypothetical protein CDAR_89651 [Caerostris darwini]